MNKVKKPSTPHNTSQYLTANFSNGRNEATVSDFTPDFEASGDIKNGEFFIPGGSMKNKLRLRKDEDLNKNNSWLEKFNEQNGDNNENKDENKDEENNYNYNYNYNHNHNYVSGLNSNEENYMSNSSDKSYLEDCDDSISELKSSCESKSRSELKEKIRKYKKIIEKQKHIISVLTNKLKRKDSKLSYENESDLQGARDVDMD
jgi:hypothetical protein